MKYIRTKCGKIVKHPHPNAEVFTFRYEIEKQADTIEELCDLYVLERNEFFEYCTFHSYDVAKLLKKTSVETKDAIANIYGAIWTEWGLKYVAKMNDKGELELL